MWKLVFSSKLQITNSGFKISTSATGVISEAFISPGPFASKISFLVPSEDDFNAKDFINALIGNDFGEKDESLH